MTGVRPLLIGDIGFGELIVIAFVAVLVFGPDKLPELAKQAGQMARKVRDFANAARDELRSELGPEYADLELRDLDPRTIVRKHIVEAMEAGDEERPATAPGSGRSTPARCRRTTRRAPRPGSAPPRARRSRPAATRSPPVTQLHEVAADPAQRAVAGRPVAQVQHAALAGVGQAAQGRAQPEPGDRRPGHLGHRPVGRPVHDTDGGEDHDQSCAAPETRHQPSATRSSRPATGPTPRTSRVTSASTDAISRLARLTWRYSARLRSASSGPRSAS